jgi:soluble lytic murein transglycosylase
MPATAREQAARLGIADYDDARLTEPALNLRLGAAYLARLVARYDGEVAFAVAAYNAGPGRVDRWRRRAPDLAPRDVIRREAYAETRGHVEKVLRLRARYAALSSPSP